MKVFIKKILYYFLNIVENKGKVKLAGFSRGVKNVVFQGKNTVPDRCNFSGKIKVGYATTFGYNNFVHGTISIGKYCQLGADVAIHSTNHPIDYLSTYINDNLFSGELKKLKETKEIIIGNDVWICHNALIVGDITIGNGAIIAAGAVVTKNVEPYAIVGGVPAKEIKKRFSKNMIKEIEELKWWDKSEDELDKIKPLFLNKIKGKTSIYG